MYNQKSRRVSCCLGNSVVLKTPTIFFAVLCIVAAGFGGCKDKVVDPPVPTQLTFKLADGLSARYSLYLDNSSGVCATISHDSSYTVPVAAGAHSYSLVDQATKCISDTAEIDAKDAVTTTVEIGSSEHTPNWVKCPRTAVVFVMSESGARYEMYLDGRLVREYSQVGQTDTVDVTAGTHTVIAKPVGCLSSQPKTLTIQPYNMAAVTIAKSNFNFSFSSPYSLVASQGTYEGYIRVTWGGVSASQYLIERKTGSGSWSQIGTSTDAAYNDQSALSGLEYTYRVKAKWSCGESGYSNTFVGYKKSVSFSDMRVAFNNSTRVMTFTVDAKAWGYKNTSMSLVLWIVRKYCIAGVCFWVLSSAGCDTNTPGDYLGYSQCIKPGFDQTIYNNSGVNMPYDCFKTQTGNYYAFFRMYSKCPISSFSDSYLSQSDVLTITWSSGVNDAGGGANPQIASDAATAAEIADLNAALASPNGIRTPDGKTPVSQMNFLPATGSENPDRAWAWPDNDATRTIQNGNE